MLRTRLYLGLLPLLLLFLAMGFYALHVSRGLARAIEQDLVKNYRALIAGYELRDAATRMHTALTQVSRDNSLEVRRAFLDEQSRFKRLLFEQSIASAGTPRMELVAKIEKAQADLAAQAERTLQSGGARAGNLLADYRAAEMRFFRSLTAIEELAVQDYQHVQEVSAQASRTVRLAINLLVAAMAGGILLSVYLSYRLARGLLRPVQALTTSARALGEGKLETRVPVLSNDELGELAVVFNDMAAKLRDYRDEMREEVRSAQRTTQATLTASPDPVVVVSREGHVELVNPAARAIGLTEPSLPAPLVERVNRVIASGRHELPSGYDQVVSLRSGREDRYYLPRTLAIHDAITGREGAAVILQDVTKFRLLDDAKSNLVGTVSHELKTPLTSLRLAVYLLLEPNLGAVSPEQKELLETAKEGADRLLRIINDLLDLSRLESGVSPMNRSDVEVDVLLRDMAREIQPILQVAGQRLEIECPPQAGEVSVDRDRIRHVFINLLGNASKYSPQGSRITLYARVAEDGFMRFGVRDEGPGIPPESMAKVFDRFYRVPGQATEQAKGAGLGLSICREIVVAHGGSIACTSEPGRGSDFYFNLPKGG
ncbi:MAG: HAMP domain-containing protein [Opitutaceae bacterium]|nr:HAMP domain-containing protein [Opitutaceae bacterium]